MPKSLQFILSFVSVLIYFVSPFIFKQIIFADWSMSRYDFAHTGNIPYFISNNKPELNWTSENLGTILAPPAIDKDGNIYLPTVNGLTKLDKQGIKKWTFAKSSINGTPAIASDGNIYFATTGCNPVVDSIDPDGNLKWEYDLRGGGGLCGYNQARSAVSLSLDKNTLLVGVSYPSDSIIAFNLDGSVKWQARLGEDPSSSIAIAQDGTLYIGTGNNAYFFALTSDGIKKWSRIVGSDITVQAKSPLVGPDNNVYVTTAGISSGDLLVSYDSLGNKRWSYKSSNGFSSDPAIKDNLIYIVEGNTLKAINTQDGSVKWTWSAIADPTESLTTPVIDKDGFCYVATRSKLYAVADGGSTKWVVNLDSVLGPAIIPANNILYIYQNTNANNGEGYLKLLGQPIPEAFLDLPWDYQAKGQTFSEAALSITSYFDHEYPLLGAGLVLKEPLEASDTVINFQGPPRGTKPYSSHDGYDYALLANVHINDPVLAAAGGYATYVNSCASCGNMIVIDHQNGYQTRYLHMQKDGLITNVPGQKVWVNARDVIGKVGATGNVTPAGDAGAHIHFGVFQDKNNDGDFEDNVPDGVTDPFGWQSTDKDPWETYNFFYNNQNRTGNKSYYLWKQNIDNLNSTLTANASVLKNDNYTLNFPQSFTDKNLNINIQSSPVTKIENSLASLGSSILITATDLVGNLVSQFQALYSITIDFNTIDLTRFDPNTLSIYSSNDGLSWQKEETSVDLENKIATTSANHMTYFTLMAKRKDLFPPVTTASLSGILGQPNWYRSDVNVVLNATDNEGGLGVDYTMYKLDSDGDWINYEQPIIITSEGHHKIDFYSVDNDENIEDFKSIEFDIDKTAPEAKIHVDPNLQDLIVEGVDSNQVTVQKEDNPSTKGIFDAFYTITDLAGNNLRINVKDEDKRVLDKFKVYTLQYNNQLIITIPPENIFSVIYATYHGTPGFQKQELVISKDVGIRIEYNPTKNQSLILTKAAGEEKTKEIRDGQTILQLTTNQGKLEYSY
ncbi:PQQ-binding-like beta-propeller repeat protein [Candidatus Daviesbacteria bacterium]|nr:PQQ-binding-like beta-propeller repeat protein [Candidatus Daviesbacteria bacterium]